MPSPTARFRQQRKSSTEQDLIACNDNDEKDSKLRIRKSTTRTDLVRTLVYCTVGVFIVYHIWVYFTTEQTEQTPGEAFELRVGNDRLEAAYNLAKREVYENIVHAPDFRDMDGANKSHFVAGYGWGQLWTRDSSYAIEQAGGLLAPEASLNSLIKCTFEVELDNTTTQASDTVWYQDECGHFGGWPKLSDAIVGARGAWFVYLYTGNTTFLNFAFHVTVNSLRRAERDVFRDGLFLGCSSFMESNSGYPLKYKNNGMLVGLTKALSTNLLYYNGYKLAVSMAKVLLEEKPSKDPKSLYLTDETIQDLTKRGNDLKQSIRHRFWMEDKGYYAYVLDEYDEFIPQMEGLGLALVLLSDDFEDSNQRARSILNNTYSTNIGIPCLWPQFDHGDVPMYPQWVYGKCREIIKLRSIHR